MILINTVKEVFDEIGLNNTRKKIAGILAIVSSIFFLYTSFRGSFPPMVQRGALLALTLPMIFLMTSSGGKSKSGLRRILDIVLPIVVAAPFVYIMTQQESLTMRGGACNSLDMVMGIIAILAVVEGCRRKVGSALAIIAGVFLVYAFLGPYMPGVLMHRGMNMDILITSVYLGEEGILGIPVSVTANFIMVFVIFASFLTVTGAGQFFSEVAQSAFGWMRGGPAKAATIASGLMGMISGSAVANVMTSGSFTIPLMKDTGYKKEMAGAIEAVASTGGQLMPPVMGAAAFIMADFLKISYGEVIIAAAIPAILYYVALFFMVDLEAGKNKLHGLPRAQLPKFKAVIKKSWFLLIPVALLITLLGVVNYSPQKSAFAALVALLVVSLFAAHTRFNARKVIRALISGSIGAMEIAAVCACAGIVIGILMRTGLGLSLTGILVEVSHGSLAVLLVLTMIGSLILGMGLPTSACYIIVAILIAPAMVKMGVVPIAAHMFAFYFGCLSAITPPIALAAYAGAGLAGGAPMQTGIMASKLGIGAFIVPFAFVFGSSLLMIGAPLEIIGSFITAFLGVYCLAICVIGYQFTNVPPVSRVLSLGAGICLIVPELQTDLLGVGVLIAISIMNYLKNRASLKGVEVT